MSPLIVLTMIVRNEAHIIERCLAPVRSRIDRYVIVDTGSTDDTKGLAAKALEGVPGRIADFEWCDDYSAARNRALELAEQETAGQPAYAWVVDADDIWTNRPDPKNLTAPGYAALSDQRGGQMPQVRLFRLGIGWKYHGVLHELPMISGKDPGPEDVIVLRNWLVSSPEDGASCKDPSKYLRRVEMLTKALATEPPGPQYGRYLFFLAESWREAGDEAKAAMFFSQRANMWPRGDLLETFRAYLEAGRSLVRLNKWDEAERAFRDAHDLLPDMPVAGFELGRLLLLRTSLTNPERLAAAERMPMDAIKKAAESLYGLA